MSGRRTWQDGFWRFAHDVDGSLHGVRVQAQRGDCSRRESGAAQRLVARAHAARMEKRRMKLPDVKSFEICTACGHVAPRGERPPHIAVMTIACRWGWWRSIDVNDSSDMLAWRRCLAEFDARPARCAECGLLVNSRGTRLFGRVVVSHFRPRRLPAESRRRRMVRCEGSGCRVLEENSRQALEEAP